MRLPRARLDWLLALLVMVLAVFAPITGGSPAAGAWLVGVASIAGAAAQGLGVLLRRSSPVPAATLALVGYALSSLAVGLTPPVGPWVVIWTTGSRWGATGRGARLAVATTGATLALIVLAELARPGTGASVPLIGLTVALTLSALLVRADRGRVEAVAARAAAEERLRVARDVHDVVGHALGVVAVQSGTARLALDAGDRDAAGSAIRVVEATSRAAMRELRRTLTRLSDPTDRDPVPRPPGIDDIDGLVAELRAGGVPVTWRSSGTWAEVPPAVQLCAFRVVQEAITNAMKHAPGAAIQVEVRASPDEVGVSVADAGVRQAPGGTAEAAGAGGTTGAGTTGQGASAEGGAGAGGTTGEGGTGMGLTGLAARVDEVGGRFRAGPAGVGWRVEAVLPTSVSTPVGSATRGSP